jgi:hypothetical protein
MRLRHRICVAVRRRALQLEKSAAGEAGQRKLNLQVPALEKSVALEKSAALEPDQKKHLRAAALKSKESPLGKTGKLHPKQQQVPVKELGKGHKRGLIESQKGPRRRHRQKDLKSKNNKSIVWVNSPGGSSRSSSRGTVPGRSGIMIALPRQLYQRADI